MKINLTKLVNDVIFQFILKYEQISESGGIGRRIGLRIRWGFSLWGFKSPLSQIKGGYLNG